MIYMRNITITTAKSATYLENVGLLWGDVQEPSLRALAAERNKLVLKAIEARLPGGPHPPQHTAGLIQTVIQGSCMQWLVEPEGELAAFMTKRTHMLLSILYPDHVFG